MVKFKVGDKAEFIERYGSYKIGDVVEVISVWEDRQGVWFKGKNGRGSALITRFKLVEPKPSKNQRITALEKELAELRTFKELAQEMEDNSFHDLERIEAIEGRLEHLEQAVKQWFTVPAVSGELSTVEDKPKTPNQQRKEIIEKAKEFVDFLIPYISDYYDKETKYGNIDSYRALHQYNVKFEVNEQKRTVVTLLRGRSSKVVLYRGIAKCHPSNVFNEHIGKAIALGRALGLDVSEFENAVQPSEVVEGTFVHTYSKHDNTFSFSHKATDTTADLKMMNRDLKGEGPTHYAKIINDTNAQYESEKQ